MLSKIKLNRREKMSVSLAGSALVVFVLIQFVIFPFLDQRAVLQRTRQLNVSTLLEMALLKAEYDIIQANRQQSEAQFRRRPGNFRLFSFLDGLAGQAGIKENINYMRPSTRTQPNSAYRISTVEIRLTGITMEQLADYMYRIETSPNLVTLKRLAVTKSKRTDPYITVILQAETLETG